MAGTEVALVSEKALVQSNRALIRRREELVALAAKQPKRIAAENALVQVSSVAKDIREALADFERQRTEIKAPYLATERIIDAWFKQLSAPLVTASQNLLGTIDDYQDRLEAERRKAAEAAAEAARQEAEKAEKAAAKKRATEEEQRHAEEAALAAEEAARMAEAPAAELVRTHAAGMTISRKTAWRGEVANRDTLDLETLRPYFTFDCLQKALNVYVRAGGRALKGAEITQVKSARIS